MKKADNSGPSALNNYYYEVQASAEGGATATATSYMSIDNGMPAPKLEPNSALTAALPASAGQVKVFTVGNPDASYEAGNTENGDG